ncbi:MAG: hypothetical protein K0S41_3384 [Anaerocolumna sp.]|nr:hypothetical protein [Anaerocolumna sp.]
MFYLFLIKLLLLSFFVILLLLPLLFFYCYSFIVILLLLPLIVILLLLSFYVILLMMLFFLMILFIFLLTTLLHNFLLHNKCKNLILSEVLLTSFCENHLTLNTYLCSKTICISAHIFLVIYYIIIVNCILFFAKSTLITLTSTISPTLTTSRGCFTNFLFVN